MRRPFIAGNWKMHKTIPEAVRLVKQLKVMLADEVENRDMVVCPTFTALQAVGEVLRGSGIKLGAQDLFWEAEGAFTGEISPAMLVDVGVEYCIIGHSERRQFFGESDDTVNKKAKAARTHDLGLIVCVGETQQQRQTGQTEDLIHTQLVQGLDGLNVESPDRLVIAYEPVWAIGTGLNATGEDANAVIAFIRNTLGELFGAQTAADIRILYGGSVKAANIKEFMSQSQIDGALVGGASLDASSFAQIVKY
ncbi:MAG: triose-phosphate isomerase [Limnochordia bacterium]|jgi:triosephosphate isomerase